VLLFEHAGYCEHFGISPAEVRTFLTGLGYTIHLLDGDLSPWHSDALPPTLNVIACRDVAAVRQRLDSPGGAPAVPPVRVDVRYHASAICTTGLTPGTKARATLSSSDQPRTE
jgi:hypothetical protein